MAITISRAVRWQKKQAQPPFSGEVSGVLCFALIFFMPPVGFLFPFSGRSVSKTHQPGIRPALPTVQTPGAHSRRSRHGTPLHSLSNAESVPDRQLSRIPLVRPLVALVWWGHSPPLHNSSCWVPCSASNSGFLFDSHDVLPSQYGLGQIAFSSRWTTFSDSN